MKKEFKVGDTVERLDTDWHGIICGEHYIVAKVKNNGNVVLEGFGDYGYSNSAFKKINKGKKSMVKTDKVKTDKMWEFNVLSDENIDFNSIYNDLSYAQPLALIESKGDKHNFYAVIHHSVLNKAKALGLIVSDTTERIANGALILNDHADFGKVISGIKKIKNATWPENCRNEAKVTVILPKV